MSHNTTLLENYVKNIGNYLKTVDEHIKSIYSTMNELDKKMKDIEETITLLKSESANNKDVISTLKEGVVQKQEFDEFVSRLTESLRELLPSLSNESEESQSEEE